MKLSGFKVQNYRSVFDSGDIEVRKLTTLVGRNESGKSNLLLALRSVNPSKGRSKLSPIKDFPRSRRLSECTDQTLVVETYWELEPDERAHIAGVFPRAKDVQRVRVSRYFGPDLRVEFLELPPLTVGWDEIAARANTVATAIRDQIASLDEAQRPPALSAVDQFYTCMTTRLKAGAWASAATKAITDLRNAVAAAKLTLQPTVDGLLAEVFNIATGITGDGPGQTQAESWIAGKLPVFVYLSDYPELVGHQNIAEYLARKRSNPSTLTEADLNFEKMCKVADLDPAQLQDLNAKGDHETRNQLCNRSSMIVTSELRRLWKDRELKVRFGLDGDHLDTFISDPNTVYDVEVNLDERSRGLKWFFSFYLAFAADTKGGPADNAILLLDEPGLHLHAAGQGDLLAHLSKDFKNQIIYTTHSPFMVPANNIDAVRTVSISQERGTTVTNSPSGDAKTLFPIQAALGYSLAQSLFVGPTNLVVEGVTDFWILSSISEYLASVGRPALPTELTLTPAGGAPKVSYMVALLTSERLDVFALLDDEKNARAIRDELIKSKLIRDDNVIFVTEAFAAPQPAEGDIEDVLEPAIYNQLVAESYKDELSGKSLNLNPNIPRIVKRYEQAFADIGIEFQKTRPARLLLRKMASDPAVIVTAAVSERFERLFAEIKKRFERHRARGNSPFL